MRVVLDGRCIQDHFPGIGRYGFNLARSLGHVAGGTDDYTVLIDPSLPNSRYDLVALASTPGLRLRPIAAPVFSLMGMIRVFHALQLLRPDVYHSPYYVRPPATPCRSVVTIFDLIAEKLPGALPGRGGPWARRAAYHLGISLALRQSARVLVPSRNTADDLRQRHGTDPAKLVLVPLGVDPAFAPADPVTVAAVRSRYDLPRRFVLSLGINKPHKNLARLVRAFRYVEPRGDVALVLAGPEDPRCPTGSDLARASGVAARVRDLGNVPDGDLAALYSAAEVFIFPSLYEGFGLPPLEAMACGTPVVCASSSSLPEVVGDAAELFDPTSEEAISVALQRVLDDQRRRSDLREAGLARASEFSWRRVAAATSRVYRHVVGLR